MPFRVEVEGGRVRGLAPGIDRRHLRRLERGEWEEEGEIDLHGLRRGEARHAVQVALREAHEAGMRCVRIVHGRGRRSELGPVLREALPGWLASAPLDSLVMAFATAPPVQGGEGATLVLLRRLRVGRR